MTDLTEEELTQIFNEASDDFLIELIPKIIEDWLPAGKIEKARKFHSDLLLIPGVKARTALFKAVQNLGFAIEVVVMMKRIDELNGEKQDPEEFPVA